MNSGGGARECDSCQSARAAVYCRADSAYLCTGCDARIHTANPISCRHHRVPLTSGGYGGEDNEYVVDEEGNRNVDYEALFGEEVDDYLDLVEFKSTCTEVDQKQLPIEVIKSEASECVVPKKDYHEMEYFGYSHAPLEHSHNASIEASRIVPDDNSYNQSSKATTQVFSAPQLNTTNQFGPMDREARVLRYREKKKTRKFEKTIRYASRKAYAEARPRIKGRFAKRTDVELEVDQMFSNYVIPEDSSYGIVPSF